MIDIFSWSQGASFSGAAQWWQHVLHQGEQQRLDYLVGAALFNAEICERLLQCDEQLLQAFQFSTVTIRWIQELGADSLDTFADAVVKRYRT